MLKFILKVLYTLIVFIGGACLHIEFIIIPLWKSFPHLENWLLGLNLFLGALEFIFARVSSWWIFGFTR